MMTTFQHIEGRTDFTVEDRDHTEFRRQDGDWFTGCLYCNGFGYLQEAIHGVTRDRNGKLPDCGTCGGTGEVAVSQGPLFDSLDEFYDAFFEGQVSGTDLNDVVMASRRLGRAELAEDIIIRLAEDYKSIGSIEVGTYARNLMKVVAELRDKEGK